MDEVSDFFKNGFISLHKNTLGKNYQQRTLKDRMNNFNNMRRETRNTLMFQKRNINENMTPINTPEPSKIVKKAVEKKEGKKQNKRLEMLNKWKAEKEKRKQEEKQKTKPLFKVCHVPTEIGLPNLEKVNKEIKGKPISQFAPPNHKFHAPKNIKPISFSTTATNKDTSLSKSKLSRKTSLVEGSNSRQNTSALKNSIGVTTRSRAVESIKLARQNGVVTKKQPNKTDIDKKNTIKKTPEQSNKLYPSNSKNSFTAGQKMSKQTASSQKFTTNKKTELKNNVNSAISNSKINTKCSSPKRSKRTNMKKNEIGLNSFNSTTVEKVSNFNKAVKIQKSNNSKICTPATINRKTPKKNKIIFEVDNKNNIKTNEDENDATQRETLKRHSSRTPRKSRKSTSNIAKKSVEWNIIEIIDSDNELLSEDINNKTPKTNTKKYNKTPRKGAKNNVCDVTAIDETFKNTDTQEQDSPVTPKNKKSENNSATPVYVSPFVTVSRGKNSARKEYQVRQSPGNVPDTLDFNKISNNISPKAGAEYFTRKLNNEVTRIEGLCSEWNLYREENNIPEEANDMVDVAIGQSNLLISKKFQQFRSLIEQCKNYEYLEKPITCEDLHGFWDMMYMQVQDLNKRFKNLADLRANNWKEVVPEKKPVVRRGRGRATKTLATSSLKDLIKAARRKKKSDKNTDGNQLLIPETNDAKVFAGGYYSIKSPVKERNDEVQSPGLRPSSARRSLRVSLLAHQTKNRLSSPGLMMMKVSQAIKCGDGLTPSKSILKNDLTKSAMKITKSVLFKDDLEKDVEFEANVNCMKSVSEPNMVLNKENDVNELNLICFSPQTPIRRSRRLSKIN